MIEYINMSDNPYEFFPYEFFKSGKISEGYKEIGEFFCTLNDSHQFILSMLIVELEDTLAIRLRHQDNQTPLFNIKIEHYTKSISRDENTILISRYCDLGPEITFSFAPNFSLKLPEIFASKDADQQMHFSQHNIGLLLECAPILDGEGNVSFIKTNEAGFTLFITIYPGSNKCFAMLTFVHYQEPVFEVTFANIAVIDIDLTKGNNALILKGKKDHEVVKILFDPTFSMELETWIFRD